MAKKKKEQNNSFATVHLSLKRDLLKRIDAKAEEENRSRVNLISVLLERVLAQEVTA